MAIQGTDPVGGTSVPNAGSIGTEVPPTDVRAYLNQHEHKSLLRFITCGSVDDGKSTLIGRLLHDTQLLLDDQLAALEKDDLDRHRELERQDQLL